MSTYAKFTLYYRAMSPTKVERLMEAQKVINAIRKEIEEEFKNSQHYDFLKKIKVLGSPIEFVWTVDGLEVKYQIHQDYLDKTRSNNQPLYLSEKTINTLLNGKLLSDGEKRWLIERITNGAIPAKLGDGKDDDHGTNTQG